MKNIINEFRVGGAKNGKRIKALFPPFFDPATLLIINYQSDSLYFFTLGGKVFLISRALAIITGNFAKLQLRGIMLATRWIIEDINCSSTSAI